MNPALLATARIVVRAMSLGSTLLGLGLLCGWVATFLFSMAPSEEPPLLDDSHYVISVSRTVHSVSPVTAILLLLVGAGLWIAQRPVARLLIRGVSEPVDPSQAGGP